MSSSFKKKRMLIANISPQGYTGIAYYDHLFSQALQDMSVDTLLITSGCWMIQPKNIRYTLKQMYVNTYGERSRLFKGLAYLWSTICIYFYLLFKNVKLIHFQLLELPVVDLGLMIALKLSGKKIIYTPHDLHSFKFGKNKSMSQHIFVWCDRVIAHNATNIEDLKNEFSLAETKIRLIRQGNYSDFLDKSLSKTSARKMIGLPKDALITVILGNIRDGKGVETAVEAFRQVPATENHVLLIAGKCNRGYDAEALHKQVEAAAKQTQIIFRDAVISDDELEAYYKAADIMLVPYERIYTSAVLSYAYSCGLACIVSDMPALEEFTLDGQDCLVFKAGDAKQLANKIKTLIDDDVLRHRLAKAAQHKAEVEWSWARTANTLKEIYEQVL